MLTPEQDRIVVRRTEELFKSAVRRLHAHIKSKPEDTVGRAAIAFVVRLVNSWRSLDVLAQNRPDTSANDCGAILRVMIEAYLQQAYILHDPRFDCSVQRTTSTSLTSNSGNGCRMW